MHSSFSRREFLASSTALLAASPACAQDEKAIAPGKADAIIHIWLGGGACQVDTWDPKRKGDFKKKPGSAYDSIPTSVAGLRVCEHLPHCAKLMHHITPIRSVHHDVVDEHAAAVNRMHTGRPTTESVVYPSMGSVVAHGLGAASSEVPAYVVIGYPNVTRGPGFLGSKYSYLYLTETDAGPAGLTRPADVSPARQARREALLRQANARALELAHGERSLGEYVTAMEAGLRLAGPEFLRTFHIADESTELRNQYGGEFGQRCLLARRLVQAGVRFVEVSFNLNFVNGTGWDTHNEGQKEQHVLIQQLDQALAALIRDLDRLKRLDRTLIVVNTEFGRPPEFDARGGRGHQPKAFTVVLAGGGLKNGQAIGATDEIGKKIVSRPVSVPDLFATIYNAVGINPSLELFAGSRPVPITDRGTPIRELSA